MWRRVWIWKRKLKNGQTYCLRWHDDAGRIRTETIGPDRKLADRLRARREEDLNAGRLRTAVRISFKDFQTQEHETMKGRIAEESLEDLEHTLRSFGEVCGVRQLADVTPAMVDRYFSKRLQDVSVATANKNLRTLKAALNRAVRRGCLERNPACDVKQVREPEKELRVLTPEEVGKLLSACWCLRWKALIALAVTTGLRLGEMLALRRQDVDLETGTIWVSNEPGHHLTKSRRNRVLAVPMPVCELLRRLLANGEVVFHTRDGRPWRNNLQTQFRRIVRRAGIEYCTIHDLRRTFVSQLAMAGVNEAMVKELAGHASISTTLRYYTRIMPQALRSAQAKLPFESVLRDISDTYHRPGGLPERQAARAASLALAATS